MARPSPIKLRLTEEHKALRPTIEGQAILDAVNTTDRNIMINAFAGCGKTSIIKLIERERTTKTMLYLVFNTDNAKQAKEEMLSTTMVKTFNGMGASIWGMNRNLTLNKRKTRDLLRQLIELSPKRIQSELWEVFWQVVAGVEMAKAIGYIPDGKYTQVATPLATKAQLHARLEEPPDPLTSELIDTILVESINAAIAGSIDFNDQVYMPALFGGAFPRYPLVAVDEYQDLNPVNHALLERLVVGRIVGVGDDYQSIYAFRGAKRGGMGSAISKYNMLSMPLSVSFRCPEKVVEYARWRVPEFKWLKPGGCVQTLDHLQIAHIPDDATFICRNNAPLFSLAFRLLSNDRSVSVAGSDIGPKLVGIMQRLGPADLPRRSVLDAIESWLSSKESETAADLAECMRIFALKSTDLGQAVAYAEHVLKATGTIRLLTGHKAKGLEFGKVFLLDSFLCRGDDQDLNLRYVMQTRSADKLYEIRSEQIV